MPSVLRHLGFFLAGAYILSAARDARAVVDMGAKGGEAQRTMAALRLGLRRQAWGGLRAVPCLDPAGRARQCLDARALGSVRVADRSVVRLHALASSERRVEVRLVSAGDSQAAGLFFPLEPGRTRARLRGSAATVEVLDRPSRSAVVSLARELLSHAWLWLGDRSFERATPGDEVSRDVGETEREACANLLASGVAGADGLADFDLVPAARPPAGTPTPAAHASEAKVLRSAGEKTYRVEPISLDVKDADLTDVLQQFARVSGLNVILDPDVRGTVTVTVTLKNAPWEQALAQLLRSNGLSYVLEGRVVRVGRPERLRPPLRPPDWPRP